MRPAVPSTATRRQAAVAVFFAAWCAVYGLPADLARNLTAQTAGFSHAAVGKPAKQARVLLDRMSLQVRRSEQNRLSFASLLFSAPSQVGIPIQVSTLHLSLAPPAHIIPGNDPARFQRPPPRPFFS